MLLADSRQDNIATSFLELPSSFLYEVKYNKFFNMRWEIWKLRHTISHKIYIILQWKLFVSSLRIRMDHVIIPELYHLNSLTFRVFTFRLLLRDESTFWLHHNQAIIWEANKPIFSKNGLE